VTERAIGQVGLALVAFAVLVLVAIGADASRRRSQRAGEQPSIDLVAHRLPAPDLALSGGARWLRSPGLEEPGAAFEEGPAVPDADPAGGVMAPPRAIWVEEQRRR
jgi:hypothetical protein